MKLILLKAFRLILTIYEFNNVVVEVEEKWDYIKKEKYFIKKRCCSKIFDNEWKSSAIIKIEL